MLSKGGGGSEEKNLPDNYPNHWTYSQFQQIAIVICLICLCSNSSATTTRSWECKSNVDINRRIQGKKKDSFCLGLGNLWIRISVIHCSWIKPVTSLWCEGSLDCVWWMWINRKWNLAESISGRFYCTRPSVLLSAEEGLYSGLYINRFLWIFLSLWSIFVYLHTVAGGCLADMVRVNRDIVGNGEIT